MKQKSLWVLCCFLIAAIGLKAQFYVGHLGQTNGNIATYSKTHELLPEQIDKIKNDTLYVIIPETEQGKEEAYTQQLTANWTLSPVKVTSFKNLPEVQEKSDISLALVEVKITRFSFNQGTSTGYRKQMYFTFYNYFGPVKNNEKLEFAEVGVITEANENLMWFSDSTSFNFFIQYQAKLRNFTPGLVGIYAKMVQYGVESNKPLTGRTIEELINPAEVAKLNNETLVATEEILIRNTWKREEKMNKNPGKLPGYKYKSEIVSYDELENRITGGNAPKYFVFPIAMFFSGFNYLMVIDTQTGEVIYSREAKGTQGMGYLKKGDFKRLSKKI